MHSAWQLALMSWSIPWAATVALLLTALVYLRGWYLLRCAGFPALPPLRAVSFLAGLATVWVALAGPMDVFNGWLLTAHMLQHMLLMMLAPPLILLGSPLIPLVRGLPVFAAREFAGPLLNWKPAQRLGRVVTEPVIALLLMGVVMLGWHIPRFYELALRSDTWHEVEHASFLMVSLIFWWPVIQPWPSSRQWPRWAMVPYLIVADLQNTLLSATLVFADHVLYPSYNEAPQVFGLSALQDQAAAGAIMWVVGSVAFLLPAMIIAVQCLTRRSAVASIQRLPKRSPVFAGQWLELLNKLGVSGTRAEAVSAVILLTVAGSALAIASSFAPADADLDLLAQQEAGDLTVSIYGPGHTAATGQVVIAALVQSGDLVDPKARLEVSATPRSTATDRTAVTLALSKPTANKLLRAVAVNIPTPGAWVLLVRESGQGQSATFSLPLQVSAQPPLKIRLVPFVWVLGAGGFLLIVYKLRHRAAGRSGMAAGLPQVPSAVESRHKVSATPEVSQKL